MPEQWAVTTTVESGTGSPTVSVVDKIVTIVFSNAPVSTTVSGPQSIDDPPTFSDPGDETQ